MTYTPHAWVEQTGAAGATKAGWLNTMETQYTEIQNYSDNTNHDTSYYTITIANSTYFSASKQGTGSGFVCERLDGFTGDQLLSAAVAAYTIALWSGDVASIPTGWHLCDGRNAYTPDLRGVFVPCGGSTYIVNATGGANTVTSTASAVTIGDHTLTTSEIPAHAHTGIDDYSNPDNSGNASGSGSAQGTTRTSYSVYTGYDGGDGAHGHTGSTLTGAGTTGNNMPAYVALCYIIKEP